MADRALIVQTAFVGDVVLTTPLFDAVRDLHRGVEVDVLVRPGPDALFADDPRIAETLVYDKRGTDRGVRAFFNLAARIRGKRYDVAYVPHRSLRSGLLVRLARVPVRVGYVQSANRGLMTRTVERDMSLHEVDRILALAGVSSPHVYVPRLHVGRRASSSARRLWKMHDLDGAKVAVVAPGSVWATKRWTPEGYGELVRRLEKRGVRCLLVGTREEAPLCRVVSHLGQSDSPVLAGETDVAGAAAVIAQADVAVTNDSALCHIAVAVGTPVVAVFGPTVPEMGFAPYGNGVAVGHAGLDCRPCSVHGTARCPLGHFRCMRELSADVVFDAVGEAADGLV
jgi:heptosyltransferase-2